MRAASLLLLLSSLHLFACAPSRPASEPVVGTEENRAKQGLSKEQLSAALMTPKQLPELFWRQRLSIDYAEEHFSLDVVLQNDEETFQVLALGPANTRLFLVSQEGKEVKLKRFVEREIPLDPALLLLDIQRALFWFPEDASVSADGQALIRGFCARDQLDASGIRERRIADLPAPCPPSRPSEEGLLIRYSPPFQPGSAPAQVILSHRQRDYTITVTHIETGELSP